MPVSRSLRSKFTSLTCNVHCQHEYVVKFPLSSLNCVLQVLFYCWLWFFFLLFSSQICCNFPLIYFLSNFLQTNTYLWMCCSVSIYASFLTTAYFYFNSIVVRYHTFYDFNICRSIEVCYGIAYNISWGVFLTHFRICILLLWGEVLSLVPGTMLNSLPSPGDLNDWNTLLHFPSEGKKEQWICTDSGKGS